MTPEEGELIHLVNKLSKIASETEGLQHLANDFPDGKLRASLEVEKRALAVLDEATDKLLMDLLASKLASDEIERVYGELPKDSTEEYARWSRLFEAAHEPILEELQKNGYKNVRLQMLER
jgi:hypothetical protein